MTKMEDFQVKTIGEAAVVSDTYDFRGRPAKRSTTGGWSRAAMILVVELNERMTTLGIAVNLVTYLTGTMHLGSAAAANAVTNFFGTSFLLCLLGGFLADTFLGRYLTIAIFAAVQAIGVTVLTISTTVEGLQPPACTFPAAESCSPATRTQLGVLLLALYLTALGTGGVKSSVSGFGSDQFDETDPSERKKMMKFFTWLFFIISLGSLMAVTVLVYVQDNVGRKWGYGIIASAIVTGMLVFLSGTKGYRFKKVVGSPLTQVAAVVVAAVRKRAVELPDDAAELYEVSDETAEEAQEDKRGDVTPYRKKLPHTMKLRFLDRAAVVTNVSEEKVRPSLWRLSPVTNVEEVKTLIGMLPIWATTIMFWTIYAQMTTFSVSQATTMNRHLGHSFEIPAGSLTVFFVISILLTVPLYDRIVAPSARRLTSNPQGLTPLQRIAVGLSLSIAAMAAAAVVELKRLRAFWSAEKTPTVFWLVPQFFLVGAGEAFTYIGQLDFFLMECPSGMKTMSTGLFLSTLSMGFFLSSALVALVDKATGHGGAPAWLADDLNNGRLYNFYWLLAALSAANLGAFLLCGSKYVYKEKRLTVADGGGAADMVESGGGFHGH